MGLGGITLSVSAGLGSTATSGIEESPVLVTNAKSIAFDGIDEFITLPQGVITSTGNFTVALWFKYDSTANHKCLVNFHSSSSNDGMQIIMQGTYDEIDVSIRSSADAAHSYRSSTEFTTDTWYHIVATKTANTLGTIYINGQADSGTTGGTWSAKGEDAIGSRKSSAIESEWNGHLDEIGIWNSVLTATEAKAIYNNKRLDFTQNSVGYVSSSSLAGWWRMGDEADTRVADNNANNLVVPDMRKTFFTGKSIDFDGSNDYIELAGFFRIGDYVTGTVSLWFKATDADVGGTDQHIFSARDQGGTDSRFYIALDDNGKIKITMGDGDSDAVIDDINYSANTWTHVAVTWKDNDGSGGTAIAYINGAAHGTTITSIDSANGNGGKELSLGGYAITSTNNSYDGQIADVSIWDAELDANTIASIYNSGEPNDLQLAASYTAGSGVDKTSNLQGYWRMGSASDDSHPTIQDQTSNNNDGTMTNMSAYDIVEHAPNRHSGDMIGFDATSDIEDDVKT